MSKEDDKPREINFTVTEVLDLHGGIINWKAVAKYRKDLIMSQLKKAIKAQVESFKK